MKTILLTLVYLSWIFQDKNINEFTANQIHYEMINAKKFFDNFFNSFIKEIKNKILKKYGFTNNEWKEILFNSGYFYFSQSVKMNKCNKELSKEIKKLPVLNNYHYSINYTYACLSKMLRSKTLLIKRIKNDKNVFVYSLTKEGLNKLDKLNWYNDKDSKNEYNWNDFFMDEIKLQKLIK